VIVVLPGDTGVTTPAEETVATDALELDQVKVWLVAFDGTSVAVSVFVVPPAIKVDPEGLKVTPVAAIVEVDMAAVHPRRLRATAKKGTRKAELVLIITLPL
jgi:hypothetical protein